MPPLARNLLVVLSAIAGPILFQYVADALQLNPYYQSIAYRIAINIALAVGLSLIIGFAGQFTIGHAGFMSVGAFFSALFTTHAILAFTTKMEMDLEWLNGTTFSAGLMRSLFMIASMTIGILTGLIASILVGIPSLRLRGDYLAIATLGFGEIVYNLLLVYLQNTAADTAFYIPYQAEFMQRTVNLASSFMLAVFAIIVVRNLLSSTTGRALPAIREDEIGASAVGIRTTRYKLLAFAIGSGIAAAAGVLDAHQTNTVNPASYRFDRSIEMIVPVVLGGSGSLTGSVLAAGVFTYILERLRDWLPNAQQYRTIVYAAVLVIVMIARPQGLMGRWELPDLFRWLTGKARPPRLKRIGAVAGVAQREDRTGPQPLECKNLTIRFGGLTAVSNFSAVLMPREILGLIGPNGAGKTTCFNMITGMYRPTSGDIRLGGKSLVGLGPAAINARGIARTFQNIRLFADLTVLDNVRVALHAHLKTGVPAAILRTSRFYEEEQRTQDAAVELLDLFGLLPKADLIATALPYGDQRRLEITRALATRPQILCLDEPAAGMNPAEKTALMRLIRDLRERFDLSILLIEHDMKVIMGTCDRIIVLDHGETIASGKPAEIQNNPRVIEAYLGEPMKSPEVACPERVG